MNKYRKFYLASVAITAAVVAYPIYMGLIVVQTFLQNGVVYSDQYPKYIIPYTPLGLALLLSIALLPLAFRFFPKHTLLVSSLVGTGVFFAAELLLEKVPVVVAMSIALPLESWQLSLCMTTPEVLRALGEPIYAADNPAFKIHFYMIALIILLATLNTVVGLSKMVRSGDRQRRRPLIAQLVSVIILIGLCILACFTAFYRNGTLQISTLSAVLMGLFFVTLGTVAGIYIGSLFYGRRPLLALGLPALSAMIITIAMYLGELVLMDGVLYRFGVDAFYAPLGLMPLAPVDLLIIVLSGGLTYVILWLVNHHKSRKTGRGGTVQSLGALFIAVSIVLSGCAANTNQTLPMTFDANGDYLGFQNLPTSYSSEQAAADGTVFMENLQMKSGAEIWADFQAETAAGAVDSIRIVNSNDDQLWFLDVFHFSDGYRVFYSDSTDLKDQSYKYLRVLTGTLPNAVKPGTVTVLTDDLNLTYEDVMWTFLSSQYTPPADIPKFKMIPIA